jgi:hypothetical protein
LLQALRHCGASASEALFRRSHFRLELTLVVYDHPVVASALPSPFLEVINKIEEFKTANPGVKPKRIVLSRETWDSLLTNSHGIYYGWIDLLKDPPTLCGLPIAFLWNASDITVE